VLGLVDVMELVCNTAGGNGKGWRDFFSGALSAKNDRDVSDTASQRSMGSTKHAPSKQPVRATYYDRDDDRSDVFSVGMSRPNGCSPSRYAFDTEMKYQDEFVYKVTDSSGNTHRIKASAESVEQLKVAVAEKLRVSVEGLTIKYIDDDQDEVVISTDASVKDAVEFARSSGLSALKLTATVPSSLALGASSLLKGFGALQQAPSTSTKKLFADDAKGRDDSLSGEAPASSGGSGKGGPSMTTTTIFVAGTVAVVGILAVFAMRKK
jgi:hypothetical protein